MYACNGCCVPKELKPVGCPLYEKGIDWLYFLKLVCEHCWTFSTCTKHYKLLAVVDYIWGLASSGTTPIDCTRGALAAAIIRAQFEPTAPLPADLVAGVNFTADQPLVPWPLLPSQHTIYTNLMPASKTFCDDAGGEDYAYRFFAPAASAAAVDCSVYRTDEQLVRSCQSRRSRGETFIDAQIWKGAITPEKGKELRTAVPPPWNFDPDLKERRERFRQLGCPRDIKFWRKPGAYQKKHDHEKSWERSALDDDLMKYEERALEHFCDNQSGAWGENYVNYHKCVLLVVAERMGFQPGQLMLDWGSGCGHTLSWAKMFYDVDGLGLEASPLLADWSTRFAAGTFCSVDGRSLEWVPDGLFDHVFTYAAFLHLDPEEQCNTGVNLVRKLRIGGKAFFGWNRAHKFEPWGWYTCFQIAQDKGMLKVRDMEVIEEWSLYPADRDAYLAGDVWIWQFPAYSVFVTRDG